MKTKQRLSDKIVRDLPVPAKGSQITYDADLSGFGARVTQAGHRSYVLNYRVAGRERRYTIGGAEEWKASAARKRAEDLRVRIRQGHDPLGEQEEDRAEPKMNDLCDVIIDQHFERLRPATQKLYRSVIEGTKNGKGIRQQFKHKRVAEITSDDVETFHRALSRRAPVSANRMLAVISKMFAVAIRKRWRGDNPARGVARNPEAKRTRYMSTVELGRLTAALADLKDQQAADIFRLLILCGSRKSEVLKARWDQFDLAAGMWVKPGSTTKQRTEHRMPLSAPAIQLLATIPRVGDYVFPGEVPGEPRVEVKAQWEKVCRAAGLVGADGKKTLRMHDVRHSFASMLASAGMSLPVIGALLGHSQPQTTARYAHLAIDPLRQAAERVGALVSGGAGAEVVRIGRSRSGDNGAA